MEKRAIITVKSFSDIEPNEAIEVVTPGTFIIHEDGFKAIYEESELSGMDGTTTTLNIKHNSMVLERVGSTSTNMEFKEGENVLSLYNTPYGMLNLNIDTKRLKINMNEEELSELFASLMTKKQNTYDNNLKKLNYANLDKPDGISIYPKNFESNEKITAILEQYNSKMEADGNEDKVISYTDMVGTLMNSVTIIVNVISYVLIAFVAISLVVSSIMIGVITYISVLERKKEIGILRAIGASKRNISQVFNAETFMIGLLAGIIGIVLTVLLLIPINGIIHKLAQGVNVTASLPAMSGLILIVLSTVLTLIGGLIPSKKAAKEDPVLALRSE